MENITNPPITPPKERKNQIIASIIGLLIIIGIAFFIFSPKTNLPFLGGNNEEDNLTEDTTLLPESGIVTVSDQAPGETIIIEGVTFSDPSWIAIYDDMGGMPGSILGARYFDAGDYKNEIVTLQIGTVAGNKYYAVIHKDDGQIVETEFGTHEFDHTKDLAITDLAGKKISYPFTVIASGARGL